jgi:hypothetical protein
MVNLLAIMEEHVIVVLVVDLRAVMESNARYGGSFLDSSSDFCKVPPFH